MAATVKFYRGSSDYFDNSLAGSEKQNSIYFDTDLSAIRLGDRVYDGFTWHSDDNAGEECYSIISNLGTTSND